MKTRVELASLFEGVGCELGVATGYFSRSILRAGKCTRLWSIDRWSDHHNIAEYMAAAESLAVAGKGRCIPLRLTFKEALSQFEDGSLDFIYIDGYAHTGQDDGATIEDWYPKLKPGGIFAGHDYCKWYPKTVEAVNRFAAQRELPINVTDADGDKYPSWWIHKPKVTYRTAPIDLETCPILADSSTILVGNGPSLLGSNLGPIIDSFDNVIRFNWFKVAGYEPHVGSKSSFWAGAFGRKSVESFADGVPRPTSLIFVHGAQPKGFDYHVDSSHGVPRSFFNDVRNRVKSMSAKTGEDNDNLLPTSGLVTALWLLEYHKLPKLTLTGFDHFSKETSNFHHYWTPGSFTKPAEHDGDVEAQIFSGLKVAGRVEYLTCH